MTALPRVLLLLASCLTVARAASAPVLEATLAEFGRQLPAGAIVAAEFTDTTAQFATAGTMAPATGVPPEQMLFEIGSITKVITALLLAETVQEGKARLDDPISRHLPGDLKLTPEVAAITLEQLASHTSGLPRLPANFTPADLADPYSDFGVDQLYTALRGQTLAAPTMKRTEGDYSNFGAGLLGHILTRIHGRSYEQLLVERISQPLGLKDTVITPSPAQQARFATPHSGSRAVRPWNLNAVAGAGAIRSTPADLVRFAQALMTSGDTPLQRAWQLVREPRAKFGGEQIGLAVMIGKVDGATSYSHGGGTGGFRTLLEFRPDGKRGVLIFISNDAIEPTAVAHKLRENHIAAAAPATAPRPADRAETPIDPAKLADYTGVFAINSQARFTVLVAPDGGLRARLTGQPFLPVFFQGDDRFFARAVAAEFQFGRDAGGKVTTLTLHKNGREVLANRTADPLPTVLPTPAEEIAAYAGDYELAPGVIFEVRPRGPNLFVKLTGQPSFPVFKDRTDHFVYDVVVAALTFERDATGKVVALVLDQNGQTPRAPKIK